MNALRTECPCCDYYKPEVERLENELTTTSRFAIRACFLTLLAGYGIGYYQGYNNPQRTLTKPPAVAKNNATSNDPKLPSATIFPVEQLHGASVEQVK